MYLRKYEVFFIVDPDLSDDDAKSLEQKLKDVVQREGGRVLTYSSWGKRKLAYPVKKRTRGHYFLMEIAGDPDLPVELERNMRLDDRVLKFITVKLEDRFEPEDELRPEETSAEEASSESEPEPVDTGDAEPSDTSQADVVDAKEETQEEKGE